MYNSGAAESWQTGWESTIIVLFVFSSVYSTLCVAKLVPPIPPGSVGPTIKCQVSKIISCSVIVSYATGLFDYFEGWHKKHKVIYTVHQFQIQTFGIRSSCFYQRYLHPRFCAATLQTIWMLCFELFPLILEISIIKKSK